jgi:XTP/dITP diphosphohydrolase
MKLLLGTKNRGKIREILSILGELPDLELLTFEDQPFSDVPEMGSSFLENARLKARTISAGTGLPVLAEDSGLEVEALGGAPGVRSARFAGEGATDEQNVRKLLERLKDVPDERRNARFVCVAVVHFPDGRELTAQGELRGRIAWESRGTHGFGYDPVFIPEGFEQTLAELGPDVKNRISHRRKALEGIKEALRDLTLKA